MQFRQHHIRFTPGIVPTAAAFVALALTLYLATWQQGRAASKRALQAEFDQRGVDAAVSLSATSRDAAALRYRQANARGEWRDSA